ncbi:hypothetical protein [Shewanella waksmanii]|uniref:hypothetical protein n=1 Tax=Shewanella waksmanii TaxID=213783 RepID=UPI0037362FC5
MLRSISAVLLSLSCMTAAVAAVSPITLLHNQCIAFNNDTYFDDQANQAFPTLEHQIVPLERHLLAIVNLRDSVQYYRHYALEPQHREQLLQCQLHLADLFEQLLQQPTMALTVDALSQSVDNKLKQLGQQFSQLNSQQLGQTPKSKLHTAQATIKRGLATHDVRLQFGDSRCEIASPQNQAESAPLNLNVANYLIRQSDPDCRQQVWQAYQARAVIRNQAALTQIKQIKAQQAQANGYTQASNFDLSFSYLTSPEKVKLFLDGHTHQVVAPWDLPQVLKFADKTKVKTASRDNLLQQVYQLLKPFGLSVEYIGQSQHRLWLDNRLLGELFIRPAKQPKLMTRRIGVVGQQFAQIDIALPSTLDSFRQQQRFIAVMAQAIEEMSYSQPYYLLNRGTSRDSIRKLGQLWLTHYLSEKLLPSIQPGSREAILADYRQQQRIFRAKVALNFYSEQANLYDDLPQQFFNSFGQSWPDANAYPYHFYGIAEQGAVYYQQAWLSALSRYIYQYNKPCQNQLTIFNALLINEDALSLTAILTLLLNESLTPTQLIERINHAQAAENKHLSTCAS